MFACLTFAHLTVQVYTD